MMIMPDFTGKKVVVIGGGNVAMDVTRSCHPPGRRAGNAACTAAGIEDMTAQAEEVTGRHCRGRRAFMTLPRSGPQSRRTRTASPRPCGPSPSSLARWIRRDGPGRPRPLIGAVRIEADIIIVAIGQGIESERL